jgi:flagellar basal body-associated protein FliL
LEGKSNFTILLIIVAVLTLTLAILAGYLFIVSGSPQDNSEVSKNTTAEYIPEDAELAKKPLFEEKKLFNLKTENNKISVIQVNAVIRYFKKVKGIKNVDEKLTFCDEQIKETVSTYFQSLTIEQVRDPECKKQAKLDLKKQLNDLLNLNEGNKSDIIYDVIFDEWFYQ